MQQLKQMKDSGASTFSRTILAELFSSPDIDKMLGKFNAGAGQDDLKSELFATLCEKKDELIIDLYQKKQLMFYATGIVQRMIFQPGNRFYRRYRTQTYEFTEALFNEQTDDSRAERESQLQAMEQAIDKDLHWVEKAMLKLHQELGSMEKISKETKISDSIDFKCDVFPDLDILSDNQLKEYNAVVYQREIDTSGKSLEKIKRYHSLGIKVIFDIDYNLAYFIYSIYIICYYNIT